MKYWQFWFLRFQRIDWCFLRSDECICGNRFMIYGNMNSADILNRLQGAAIQHWQQPGRYSFLFSFSFFWYCFSHLFNRWRTPRVESRPCFSHDLRITHHYYPPSNISTAAPTCDTAVKARAMWEHIITLMNDIICATVWLNCKKKETQKNHQSLQWGTHMRKNNAIRDGIVPQAL